MFLVSFFTSNENHENSIIVPQNPDEHLLTASFQGNNQEIINALNNGAKIDITSSCEDFNGYTPLLICTHIGYDKLVKTLIERNANIYAETYTQQNILHLACASGHKNIIEQLFTIKSSEIIELLNKQDKNQNTPLHLSIFNKEFISTTEYLLELGAKTDLKNDKSKSALDCARDVGHTETINLIESSIVKKLISNTLISIRAIISDKAEKGFNFSDSWILNKAISTDSKIIINDKEKLVPKTESEVFNILDNNHLDDISKYLSIKEKYMVQYQPGWFSRSNDTLDFRISIKNLFLADDSYLTTNKIKSIEQSRILEDEIEFDLLYHQSC